MATVEERLNVRDHIPGCFVNSLVYYTDESGLVIPAEIKRIVNYDVGMVDLMIIVGGKAVFIDGVDHDLGGMNRSWKQ